MSMVIVEGGMEGGMVFRIMCYVVLGWWVYSYLALL